MVSKRWLLAACAGLAVALVGMDPGVVWARGKGFEAGRDLYLRGEFRAALVRLRNAEKSPELTEEQVVAIHWYRAACHPPVRHGARAAREFDAVLALRPLYEPDPLEAPPDLRAAFQKHADGWQQRAGVTLEDPEVSPPVVVLHLRGQAQRVATVTLFVRQPGQVSFTPFTLPVSGDTATARVEDAVLWQQAAQAGQLELVAEALSAANVPQARLGDRLAPFLAKVDPVAAQAAAEALAPPPSPQVEAATPAQAHVAVHAGPPVTDDETAAEEDEDGSAAAPVWRLPALAAGGGLAGVGALVGLAALAAALGAGAAAATVVYAGQALGGGGGDKQGGRSTMETAWRGGWLGLEVLGPTAAVLGLVALGAIGTGVAVAALAFLAG